MRAMATPRKRPTKEKRIPLRVEPELHAAAHELAGRLGYGTVSTMVRVWLRQAINLQAPPFAAAAVARPAPARRSRAR